MKAFGKWMPLLLLVAVVGCGGGGGGSSSSPPVRSASLGVFATDSPDTENNHVWATIFKVEVVNQSGGTETVFDDSAGKTIDLKTLRDANGQRFAFLADGSVKSGTHTSVRVTIGNTLTLFPTGTTTGKTTLIDASLPRDAQGHVVLSFNLKAPRNLGAGSDDLVIDFDLANFIQSGGKIRPVLQEGGKNGLNDPKRHEAEDIKGTISDLSGTAPNFTFSLTIPNHPALAVATNTSTSYLTSDGSSNPTLANGKTVEVRGKFDITANRLNADTVKIEMESGAQAHLRDKIEGAPSEIDATALTFSVSTHKVRGFTPTATTVKIVTTANTVYASDHGVKLNAADFFTALATAQQVNVEGKYDAATNTLTADNSRLEKSEDQHNNSHEAEAKGAPTTIVAGNGTFTLHPLSEWQGFVPSGNSVAVATNGSTVYSDANGHNVSATDFFAALATATTVRVDGNFANDTLTATKVSLQTSGDGNHGDGNSGDGNHGDGNNGAGNHDGGPHP